VCQHHKFECVISAELHQMCTQLPAVAQQELSLLVRVALTSMAPIPTPSSLTPPSGDTSSQGVAQVQDAGRAMGEGVVNNKEGGGGIEGVRVEGGGCGGGWVEYVADLVDVCAMPSHHLQLLSVDPQRAAGFPNPEI
jgi:hypothetical protein